MLEAAVIETARSLGPFPVTSLDSRNPEAEYLRALVEMTTRLLGLSHDEDDRIEALILADNIG